MNTLISARGSALVVPSSSGWVTVSGLESLGFYGEKKPLADCVVGVDQVVRQRFVLSFEYQKNKVSNVITCADDAEDPGQIFLREARANGKKQTFQCVLILPNGMARELKNAFVKKSAKGKVL